MELALQHEWTVTPRQAVAIQLQLKDKIILKDKFKKINRVAGVDVGFQDNGKLTRAAIAVLDFPSLELEEVVIGQCETKFPYVPGLLSFREIPAVINGMKQLKKLPDLLLCDGHGYAHPRRFGLASHLGLITDIPSIGVGKTRLIGKYQPVPNQKGAWQPLLDGEECIGAVLRSRKNVQPIYVSVGYKISLETAVEYVMKCITRYKLPETTRLAHKHASQHLQLP